MIVERQNTPVATRVEVASSLIQKTLGLMFSKDLGNKDALLIESCNSIHTFFMNYPIDVVFLSKNDEVIKVYRNLKPWRMTPMYFKASKVLELMGGTLHESVVVGDKLDIKSV
jgi:uncharacterized membrane protein (UPF0127 family)